MYNKAFLSALSGFALVSAQSSATNPAVPSSAAQVPTIEGALTYDGPPVIGFTGPGGNATVQANNPQATYQAILPSANFDSATGSIITGSVLATTGAGGTGVTFNINFTGFPSVAEYGPFVYHIHELAVPADGNCTATLGHLDPTQRGELHACEAQAPQTCQAGDLAGKHGNVTAQTWTVSYTDNYLSTVQGSPYFFGDKSIVIHSSNATRLTCANFALVSSTSTNGTNGTAPTATGTPSVSPFAGGAAATFGTAGALTGLLAAAAAFLL
ncbi:MAG: hypothetical protein LQ340_003000 [Diploschistes diacapsis]|nr:MAG: hypothetical protein LQ340_003000 [Diploschistes diacapsis]